MMTASEENQVKMETQPPSPKETRKSAKPIMEKRRRARINASLSELKALLLEVLKKEGSRHSKMEKADILEMTVKHLRSIQRQQFSAAVTSDPTTFNKYHAGFSECATEVSRYLGTLDGVDIDLRARVLNHLANKVQHTMINNRPSSPVSSAPCVSQMSTATPMSVNGRIQGHYQMNTQVDITPKLIPQTQQIVPQGLSQNASEQTQLFGGIQIVPARLPTGEISFVVPGNMLQSNQIPSYVIPVYASPAVGSPTTPSSAITTQSLAAISPTQQTSSETKLQSMPFMFIPGNSSPVQVMNTPIVNPVDIGLSRRPVWRPW